MRNFNEDEIMSRNIRFFFPDGCQKYLQDQIGSGSQINSIYSPPPTNSQYRRPTPTTTTQAPFTSDDVCAQRVPECTCTCSYGAQ
jgi:hypothetical protein